MEVFVTTGGDVKETASFLLQIAEVQEKLGVMDITAVTLCMDNNIPIAVFNMLEPGNICRMLDGESIGTVIS